MTKSQLIYSISCFNLGGLEFCSGGLSTQKPPRGDGTDARSQRLPMQHPDNWCKDRSRPTIV